MFKIFIITLSTLTITLHADDIICVRNFEKVIIDQRIKTTRGWLRVCNNNKISLYSKTEITDKLMYVNLCDCLRNKNDLPNNRVLGGFLSTEGVK